MRILLLNFHSARNAGDLAILQTTLIYLNHAFPHAHITYTVNDVYKDVPVPVSAHQLPSFVHWLAQLSPAGIWRWHKWRFIPVAVWLLIASLWYRATKRQLLPQAPQQRQLMHAYYLADVVIVLGGGHLYARHSANIAFQWSWVTIALAVLMGKPLLLLPQSFGPLPGLIQQRQLRWMVEHSAFTAAREYQSALFLTRIGVRTPLLVLPDLAFGLDSVPAHADMSTVADVQGRTSRPVIGMTLMNWGQQNAYFEQQQGYETAVSSLINHVVEQYQATIVLFAQCVGPTPDQDDRIIARRIAANVNRPDDVVVVDAALDPATLKAAYGCLDMLIATRMHSAIFALCAGTPTLVIGYLHKSAGIMQMLGLAEWVIDINTIEAVTVCALFDQLWIRREEVQHMLDKQIPMLHHTLAHLPTLLRESVASAL